MRGHGTTLGNSLKMQFSSEKHFFTVVVVLIVEVLSRRLCNLCAWKYSKLDATMFEVNLGLSKGWTR